LKGGQRTPVKQKKILVSLGKQREPGAWSLEPGAKSEKLRGQEDEKVRS